MEAKIATAALIAMLAIGGARAQSAPDRIDQQPQPNVTVCGRTAATISDLQEDIAEELAPAGEDERFVVYFDEIDLRAWIFTRKSHTAHPAIACRSMVQRDGAWHAAGDVLCRSSADNCAALGRELEQLDDRMTRDEQNKI